MINQITKLITSSLTSIGKDLIARLPHVTGAIVLLVTAYFLAKFGSRITQKLMIRYEKRPSLIDLMQRLVRLSIWGFAIIVSAMMVFPGLTPAKALGAAGLASVAIGLAFKDIFQNFFAGILLLWKFPFEKGDTIECNDTVGNVEDIELRMTTIRKPSGELVVLPNSDLITNSVKIVTNQDLRRIEMMTGVGYGENVQNAVEVIEEALSNVESINQDRDVRVLPSGFGASSIDISLLFWTGSKLMDERVAKAEVLIAVKSALDEAGIEIPFPYRTLTFDEPLQINMDSTKAEPLQEQPA